MGNRPEWLNNPEIVARVRAAFTSTQEGYNNIANDFAAVSRYISEHDACLNQHLRTFVVASCARLQSISLIIANSIDGVITLLVNWKQPPINLDCLRQASIFLITCQLLLENIALFANPFLTSWQNMATQGDQLGETLSIIFNHKPIRMIFVEIFSSIIRQTVGDELAEVWKERMRQIYENEEQFMIYVPQLIQ
jgi:hypothetical protein